jgi:hypothetical protein
LLSIAAVDLVSRFHVFHGIYPNSAMNGQHGQHETLPSMPLQASRNPEHLSMSRDSNSTKHVRPRGDVHGEGLVRKGIGMPASAGSEFGRSKIESPNPFWPIFLNAQTGEFVSSQAHLSAGCINEPAKGRNVRRLQMLIRLHSALRPGKRRPYR